MAACIAFLSPEWSAVLLAAGYPVISWLLLAYLYRKKTFLKG